MFGFDDRYAMFDITPVENQFILDYLPAAKGDYIKVYLYGLMRCYHPEEDMSTERMCRELDMTEEEVTLAFGYWERRGLVRRVSDHPPRWQYINIKQKNLSTTEEPDPEYEAFSTAIYEAFDKIRRLHGSEISACFEWHEAPLSLPTEVIIMLLHHMAEVKGRHFRITEAEKVAVRMANEDIRTVDAAEAYLSRDEKIYNGIRSVLKKLGKKYLPSEAQVALYRKWVQEWHFSPQAIDAATELTVRGDPTLPYLDGILNGLRQDYGDGRKVTPEVIRASDERAGRLRTILKALGSGEVNGETLAMMDRMLQLYPMDVILTGAKECRQSGREPADLLKLLESWHQKGLDTPEKVNGYVQAFHEQTEFIKQLRGLWGLDTKRVSRTDREALARWEEEMGMSRELIQYAAAIASEGDIKQPMSYLGKILESYREKGIRTPEEAEKERTEYQVKAEPASGKPGRKNGVIAQQYGQRSYDKVQDELIEQQNREMEEYLRRNGGSSDA